MVSLPVKAAQLSFAYDQREDRILLLAANAEGEALALQLTRRLTSRIVNAVAQLLEKSSTVAQHAPAEMRDDVILLEHQEALHGQPAATKAGAEGSTPDSTSETTKARSVAPTKIVGPAQLVHTIQITTKRNSFSVVIKGGRQDLAALSVSRTDLHRVLETIRRVADKANWQITIDASWLMPEDSEVVLN